jgi:hypothetical protein
MSALWANFSIAFTLAWKAPLENYTTFQINFNIRSYFLQSLLTISLSKSSSAPWRRSRLRIFGFQPRRQRYDHRGEQYVHDRAELRPPSADDGPAASVDRKPTVRPYLTKPNERSASSDGTNCSAGGQVGSSSLTFFTANTDLPYLQDR